jgi:HSP20 family protein
MRNMMDRLIEQSFGRISAVKNGEDLGAPTLGLDVYETNDSYVVKAAIPGVDPGKVDISVEDDVLTIKGEFERRDEAAETSYIRRELSYGAFQRSLRLPPTVDADNANAQFEYGLLTLTLPKKPEARARTIKITPQVVIEGSHNGGSQN